VIAIAGEAPRQVFQSEMEPEGVDTGQVCDLHSSVVHPWIEDRQAKTEHSVQQLELAAGFDAERDAPGQARRMVVATLRQKGYGDRLVQDAALILTELAANAVLHAGSPFSISVSLEGSMLHIAVSDRSPAAGVLTGSELSPRAGRGLGLIDTISADWGTAAVSGGKVVWAKLEV
jgi:anti-sigma regulatory factor (Ser/Thr protein kinase)